MVNLSSRAKKRREDVIVVIYSLSIVFSFLWKLGIQLYLLNMLAGFGYKYKELRIFDKNDIVLIVPILNVIVIYYYHKKIKTISNIDDSFLQYDIIKMDLEEQEIYQKKKTFYRAFKINISKKVLPTMILTYMEDGECNEIYFSKSENKYIVISTRGKISTYSKKKQLNKLKMEMQEIEKHDSSPNDYLEEKSFFNCEGRKKTYFEKIHNS